ncbi:MAG: MOSC domain-containing protein [Boseongicola sp.]
MMSRFARPGRIEAILLRPERLANPISVQQCQLNIDGLKGDHARAGKRAVTLIQAEHLPIIAEFSGLDAIDPAILRRNIVVSGLNLLGFRKARLRVGQAILEVSGPCPPCSRMEKALGHGGFTAMRGHGGVYAEVIAPGTIEVGDLVEPV